MRSSVAAFIIAFLVSALLTPVVRALAMATGVVDEAGGRRIHTGRMPRMGGIAVAVAFFVPLIALLFLDSDLGRRFYEAPGRIWGLAIGSSIVLALGVVDDVTGVRPFHKLLVQALAATIAWSQGYTIDAVALPYIGNVVFGGFSLVITVIWFIGVINALNLIDGLDGLAAGLAFFACVTNLLVGAVNDGLIVVLLSASLGGGLLGFLVYNFNPASIFMGDSGSMFLGFVLAATSLLGSTIKGSTTVAILVPIVALGVPITDTVWAFARRVRARRSIFSADRGHIHHRLLDMGLSQRHAVMLLYGFALSLAALATGLALGRSLAAGGALILMAILLVGVVRTSRSFAMSAMMPVRQRPRTPIVETLREHLPTVLRGLHQVPDLESADSLLADFSRAVGIGGHSLLLPRELSDSQRVYPREMSTSSATARRLEYPLSSLGDDAKLLFWLRDSPADDQVHIMLQLVADEFGRRFAATKSQAQTASCEFDLSSEPQQSLEMKAPHVASV